MGALIGTAAAWETYHVAYNATVARTTALEHPLCYDDESLSTLDPALRVHLKPVPFFQMHKTAGDTDCEDSPLPEIAVERQFLTT